MREVVDTNGFVVAIPRKLPYHWLFQSFLQRKFDLLFSNEILTEYEEQSSFRWEPEATAELSTILLVARNSVFVDVYFFLNLITQDDDDNKFADCAFAGAADYLVTFDKHFNVLKKIDFPKITVVHPKEFKQILLDRNLI